MPRRTALPQLPPPPPPAALQSWPDRAARLADRALALDDLARRALGIGRLALFLTWLALLQLGWGLVGVGLTAFDGGAIVDPISWILCMFSGVLGLGVLVPGVWLTVRSLRRDRVVHERFVQWAALDRDPVADARLRAPGLSVCWLLLSFALCAVGLWTAFAVPLTTTRDNGGYPFVVYGMGAALLLWVTGLTGLAKAAGHYRIAVRLTGPVSGPPGDRSASSALPRPE
ncbi:hypothetical protein ACFYU9_13140 [Streptomyces sp. NPDC004327]|uniref:hypothetical protein n=1 Tax=unclassified Streptomyces TaxID=2593676 RepID=UPI0036BB7E26